MTDWHVRFPGSEVRTRVRVRPGALRDAGTLLRSTARPGAALVVTDSRVAALYGTTVRSALTRAGIRATLVRVPRGEAAKDPRVLERVWAAMAETGLTRADALVALGGGSVGDLAGFAAATWMRGIPWMVVPTTLLAQADSSLGGKTAVDLQAGKNLVGAFHQPVVVLSDPATLATLTHRDRRAGLAEVVKIAMAADAAFFRWLERHRQALAAGDPKVTAQALVRAARAKLAIVRRDERERHGLRTALNFGHTLGHALERAQGYRGVRHGEAVALGMRAAARLSVARAGLDAASARRLESLLDDLGLPRRLPPSRVTALIDAMRADKKRRDAEVRWVLTPRMGHASVPRPIDRRLVTATLIELGARI